MNLIWFLTVGTILSTFLGEFGKYPFGSTGLSFGVTDVLVSLTLLFLIIWQVGIKKDLRLPPAFQLLTIFWLVGAFSLILSGNLSGGFYLIRFMVYSSLFLVGFLIVGGGATTIQKVVSQIILAGILLAGAGFLQLLILPDLAPLEILGFDPHKNRLVSTFLDPNFTGTLLSLAAILSLYNLFLNQNTRQLAAGMNGSQKNLPEGILRSLLRSSSLKYKKKIWFFTTAVLLTAIFLTFSRSAYLMLFIEIIGLSFLKSRKILLVFLIGFILLYFSFPIFRERVNGAFQIDKSAAERFESWSKAVIIFQKSPIFGVGFNNLRTISGRYNLFESNQAQSVHSGSGVDSSLLFVLSTTGLVGLLVYLTWWAYLIFSLLKEAPQDKNFNKVLIVFIAALLVNSQFINSLFYPEIMAVYFILLGASSAHSSA